MVSVAPRLSDNRMTAQNSVDLRKRSPGNTEMSVQETHAANPAVEQIIPPAQPGEWPLEQIVATLSRPLPKSMLETKQVGGTGIPFISWYTVNRILNKYAPGWTWEIRTLTTTGDRLFLVGRLTIPTADGPIWREATGTEELKEIDRRTGELKEISYGDPSSNAESMAFRRAAARFGLGLYLYE